MKALFLAALGLLFTAAAFAQATANRTVTCSVAAINLRAVSGNPGTMTGPLRRS